MSAAVTGVSAVATSNEVSAAVAAESFLMTYLPVAVVRDARPCAYSHRDRFVVLIPASPPDESVIFRARGGNDFVARVHDGSSMPAGRCPTGLLSAGRELALLDREDFVRLELEIADDAGALGDVHELRVIEAGWRIADAQPLIRVDRAVAVVLALVGAPARGARGREIELGDGVARKIPEPYRPLGGERERGGGGEHENRKGDLAHVSSPELPGTDQGSAWSTHVESHHSSTWLLYSSFAGISGLDVPAAPLNRQRACATIPCRRAVRDRIRPWQSRFSKATSRT